MRVLSFAGPPDPEISISSPEAGATAGGLSPDTIVMVYSVTFIRTVESGSIPSRIRRLAMVRATRPISSITGLKAAETDKTCVGLKNTYYICQALAQKCTPMLIERP